MNNNTVVTYEAPGARDLRARVDAARARLAELEAAYTIDKARVDTMQANFFKRLRVHREERDRIRLVVDYWWQFLSGTRRGDKDALARANVSYREAKERHEREYEETARTFAEKKELTAEDEADLGKLWKSLVKLYHPDRFAHDPQKLETYGLLTAAINRAKDHGDLPALRKIANDPRGFILKQGWPGLDFQDDEPSKRLEQLLESLEAEIRSMIESHRSLRESPGFELSELTTKMPAMIEAMAEKQADLLKKEIADLKRQAQRLAEEIEKLTGNPPPAVA